MFSYLRDWLFKRIFDWCRLFQVKTNHMSLRTSLHFVWIQYRSFVNSPFSTVNTKSLQPAVFIRFTNPIACCLKQSHFSQRKLSLMLQSITLFVLYSFMFNFQFFSAKQHRSRSKLLFQRFTITPGTILSFDDYVTADVSKKYSGHSPTAKEVKEIRFVIRVLKENSRHS